MQTATDFIKEELDRLGLLDKGQVMTNIFEKAKKIEHNQRGYTKEDVFKAGEIGEINHHDYKHIVKLLDEARAINETYGSKGSDETKNYPSEIEEYTSCPICNGTSINGFCSTPNCAYSLQEPYKDDLEMTVTSSQTEISDEEILARLIQISSLGEPYIQGYKDALIWYREQLKKKQ